MRTSEDITMAARTEAFAAIWFRENNAPHRTVEVQCPLAVPS